MDIIEQARKTFGNEIGHFPELWSSWNGPSGYVFWASGACWNSYRLHTSLDFPCKIAGPFSKESAPFKVPFDGYAIFIAD